MKRKTLLSIGLLILCFFTGFMTLEFASHGAAARLAGKFDGEIGFNMINRIKEWARYFPSFIIFLVLPYEHMFRCIKNVKEKTKKQTLMNIGYILGIFLMIIIDGTVIRNLFVEGEIELFFYFVKSPSAIFTFYALVLIAINLYVSEMKHIKWWEYELTMIATGCLFGFLYYKQFALFSNTCMLLLFSIATACITLKVKKKNHVLHILETACIVAAVLLIAFIITGDRWDSIADWLNLNQNRFTTNFDHNILHRFWYEDKSVIFTLESPWYVFLCYPLLEIYFGGGIHCGAFLVITILSYVCFIFVAKNLVKREKRIVFDSLVFLTVMLLITSVLSQLTIIPTVSVTSLLLFGCKEVDYLILALLIRLLINPYEYIYQYWYRIKQKAFDRRR